MEKISTNHMVKIGIVVENIEEAVQYYADLFKIDLPEVRLPAKRVEIDVEKVPTDGNQPYVWYRGEYSNPRIKTAIIPLEPIFLELIEPLDEPSPWTEFKNEHGQGVQFMTFHIEGFDEHIELMEKRGFPAFHKQEKGKERYAYFETAKKIGTTIEFKEIDKN